jgi:putative peptide zinc metalloprotease protein
MMFVASVSTVLFNLNPLLRFDGYYILSDLLEIPNLHQRSANQLKHFFKRYLFGVKKSESPARSGRERFWLVTFGILSNIYRIVVFSGILLFVADRFLLLGIIMAVVCLVGWIVAPVTKFLRFLASDPSLDRTRPRAVGVTCLLVGGILAFLQFVPFPTHFRAPGVLQAEERAEVITEVSGTVREVFVPSGTEVKKGDRLVRLSNEELGIQMRGAMASLEEVDGRIRQAMREEPGLLKPLAQQRKSVAKLVARMQREIELQTLRARIDGIWVAPRLQDYSGRFVVRGTPLGMVIDPARFEFSATVPQTEADRLFKSKLDDVELRLHGEEGRVLQLAEVKRIPGDRRNLPSPALSWRAGGEVMTDSSDPEGRLAAESFFEVRGHLEDIASIAAFHGRTGTVRFYVGNEALLPGWMRSLRQLLQKRYQL